MVAVRGLGASLEQAQEIYRLYDGAEGRIGALLEPGGGHRHYYLTRSALLWAHAHLQPAGMTAARIEAMEWEGAKVTMGAGDSDDAVARSAQEAGERCIVVSDTSWPGYETIPAQVIEGYTTIFAEVDEATAIAGGEGGSVMYEQYLSGREFTVGILDGEALPVVEIEPVR